LQDLAVLLPNLATVRRPSKSAIVNSSISLIHSQRRFRLSASRELRALKAENDVLRRENNEWRERSGNHRVEEPARSVEFNAIMGAADEVDPVPVRRTASDMGYAMELGDGDEDEEDFYAGSPTQPDFPGQTATGVSPLDTFSSSAPSLVHPHLVEAQGAHFARLARLQSTTFNGTNFHSRSLSVGQMPQLQPTMQLGANGLLPLTIPVDPTTVNDNQSRFILNAQIYNALAQQSVALAQQAQILAQQETQFTSPIITAGHPFMPAFAYQTAAQPVFNGTNNTAALAEEDLETVGSSSSSPRSASSAPRRDSPSESVSSPVTTTSSLSSSMFMPTQSQTPAPGTFDAFAFAGLSSDGWDAAKVGVTSGGGGAISIAALGMFM
jgi:hypothetical protein